MSAQARLARASRQCRATLQARRVGALGAHLQVAVAAQACRQAPAPAAAVKQSAAPRALRAAVSVAKASAVAAAARRIWSATANPDGPGLLERGREYQP